MKRRQFIQSTVVGGTSFILPLGLLSFADKKQKLKFGVCADVHKDVMHDADERLKAFIDKASIKNSDFIIQLGDFCQPADHNREFLSIWESYSNENYHVIGNHETDGGFNKQQVIDVWKMPKPYYSFDKNGFHIIVLDGNDKNPSENKAPGYARFVGKEQIKWLTNDLQSTKLPCIIFSHQSIEKNIDGLENRAEIRELFEKENQKAGLNKVVACFSGHHHTDYVAEINEIYYIQINSMSYQWLGGDYKTIRYSKEIDEKFEWIKYTAPYREPLYAFIEINQNQLIIKGVKSSFVGPSPDELDCPKPPENNPTVPFISDRNIKF